MQTIVTAIMADPAMPPGAGVLQNLSGGDGQSVPDMPNPTPVIVPLLDWARSTFGNRYVISWNEVSLRSDIPTVLMQAAQAGTPMMLQLNSTANGAASCDGIEPDGSKDKTPATPACIALMEARFLATFPPASTLVAWQASPGDWSDGAITP